ncbi:MAG: UDP-2,3-diacylglucosamine diphosphatase [Candidatus Zixiibacteriota bacterium]
MPTGPLMENSTPVIFFSDAHFGAHDPARESMKIERFVTLLDYAAGLGAEVFFLGDLFDFWFEYKYWIPKVPLEILTAIQRFTRGDGVFHLVLGNHDTWATDYFSRDLGVRVHRGDVSETRHGLRLFLSHGDGKAKSDRGYRILKRVLRFPVNIALYRLLPADWAFGLANFFSGQSRELTSGRPPKFLEEYDTIATQLLAGEYDAVLMGHLHQGWVRQTDGGWWINTGEFFEAFHYVLLEEERFSLHTWDGTPPVRTVPAN